MTSDSNRIVALEGPSYSGKSTVAELLRQQPGARVHVLPCYVDVAGGDAAVPGHRAKNAEAQLRALEFFIELDGLRSSAARAGSSDADLLLLDRSWLSLLAHTYAIARTGGPDVFDRARTLLAEADVARPDLVLYLRASERVRHARVPVDRRGDWNANAALNEAIDEFFATLASECLPGRIVVLDGNLESASVCAAARAAIEAVMR